MCCSKQTYHSTKNKIKKAIITKNKREADLLSILKRYLPYLKNYKLRFFSVFIGILMTIAANVGMAQIMQPMMDKLFIAKQKDMLVIVPLMMLGIFVLKGVGRYIQSVFTSFIGQQIVTQFRSLVVAKMLRLDMEYINSVRSGELISRVMNDIGRIQYFVSLMLPEFIRESLTVIALVGYVVYLNPALAFYSLIVLPVVLLPIAYLARKLRKISFGAQEKNADLLARLGEIFNNIELVKTSASESFEVKRFAKENWEFFKVTMKSVYFGEMASPILEIIGAMSIAIVIFLGAKEVYADKMSVGEFMAFLTAIGLVFQPARGLGIIYAKMQDALAASQRVFEVLDTPATILDGSKELEKVEKIEFRDVCLDYGETKALDGVSFVVERPKKVAFVGESGGGKSSIVNLLVRLYDATAGEVLYNDVNIKEYRLSSLRKEVSVISQRVYIFQDTIAYNVAYGMEFDEARVIEALKAAHAWEFVEKMEEGIYTLLQENGTNLSGGQRQRIALARAFYKNSSVLILDEATSALDNESEAKILDSIEHFATEKIVIAIAHRLTTVEEYDTIYMMQKGWIVESGTHAELLERSSYYQELYKKSIKE